MFSKLSLINNLNHHILLPVGFTVLSLQVLSLKTNDTRSQNNREKMVIGLTDLLFMLDFNLCTAQISFCAENTQKVLNGTSTQLRRQIACKVR